MSSKDALNKILDSLDIEDFYAKYFEKLDGSNLPCPFPERHKKGKDSLPSFRVFTDTGGTYCHGCGYKSTTPINFWADLKKVSFDKALRHFYGKYVEPLVDTPIYMDSHKKLVDNGIVLQRVRKFRGLSLDTVKRFKIGYDGKRLTIPIFNDLGWCVNVRRYNLFKDSGPNVVSLKKGMGSARLFPLESLRGNMVFVVEGELDAIIGCQNGLSCVTPSGGSMTWQEDWGKLFKGKDIGIVPDNDEPGREGAIRRYKSIAKYAKSCKLLKLPVKGEGEDLTDYFVKYDGTALELRKMLRSGGGEEPLAQQSLVSDVLDLVEGAGKSKLEELMVKRSEAVWADLNSQGAFFKSAANELFYTRKGMSAMKVSANPGPFMSLLHSRSPLINQATSVGKFIFNHILYKANGQSELSKTGVWSLCDGGNLYVHAGKDEVLKVTQKSVSRIKNAINKDRVLLDLPIDSMSIPSIPNASPVHGLNMLKELFMENLAMQEEDRYLLVCWLFSIFFRDYVKPKPIVRLLAKTASGKSTSSKLSSILLYGEELLSHSASTIAATYEMSSRYPLLILDNLETRNMTYDLEDFLLVAATGGMKAKRKTSSDTGLILQHTNSLVMTNGIEPFSRHELIDRTMEIDLDIDHYGNRRYQEARVFRALKDARTSIMSSMLFLIQRYVMPRIARGHIAKIMKEFGYHGKERFNEYLAVMCLVLDALWGYMPFKTYRRPHDLVNFWLDSQTKAEQRQDEGTNEVLYFLSTFIERGPQLLGACVKVETLPENGFSMRCSTREMLSDFRILAKYLGIKCPWLNERQLGTRIADAEETLTRAGWTRRPYASMGRLRYEYTFKPKNQKGG